MEIPCTIFSATFFGFYVQTVLGFAGGLISLPILIFSLSALLLLVQ